MQLTLEDDLWWSTTLRLPAWAGYQSRFSPYTSVDKPEPSDGTAKFVVGPDGRGGGPLSADELTLIQWFDNNEPAVSAAVQTAIRGSCPSDLILSEADLKQNCGLYSVYLHQLIHSGLPYIGYELGCTWEEEHGLGVLMHGTRLVAIGDADTALHLWVAQKDAAERVSKG